MVIIDKNYILRDRIIKKGGDISKEIKKVTWKVLSLRITEDLVESIDNHLKSRVGTSRNSWMLDAIQQKLKKEME